MQTFPQKQTLSRSVRLEHNLKEQIDWLTNNLQGAYFSGFTYAHKASKDLTKPTQYCFDNSSRKASGNSTLASLSEVGDFELQAFRLNDSPCRNGYTNTDSSSAIVSGVSGLFSSFPSYPSYDQEGGEGQDGLGNGYNNGSGSNSRVRPTAGSFLGTGGASGAGSRGFQPGRSGYSERDSSSSIHTGSGNNGYGDNDGGSSNNGNSGRNSNRNYGNNGGGSAGGGGQAVTNYLTYNSSTGNSNTGSIYNNSSSSVNNNYSNNSINSSNNSSSSSSSSSSNNSNNNNSSSSSSSSSSSYRNKGYSNDNYSDDISDSQLAFLDVDGQYLRNERTLVSTYTMNIHFQYPL